MSMHCDAIMENYLIYESHKYVASQFISSLQLILGTTVGLIVE